MISPWFLLCLAAVAFYYHIASPRYNRTFGILCGMFLATGLLCLGVGKPWPAALF